MSPQLIELAGDRVSGTLPVTYGHDPHGRRCITFGHGRYNTGAEPVEINGIDWDIASIRVICQDMRWRREPGHVGRRYRTQGAWHFDYETDSVRRKLDEWAVTMAGRLAESNEPMFAQALVDQHVVLADGLDRLSEDLLARAGRVGECQHLHEMVADGDAYLLEEHRGVRARWAPVDHCDSQHGRVVAGVFESGGDGRLGYAVAGDGVGTSMVLLPEHYVEVL